MNQNNTILFEKHKDILSFRDLAVGTVATYLSYLNIFIQWFEENFPGRVLSSVTWTEIRSYVRYEGVFFGHKTYGCQTGKMGVFS